MTEGELSPYDVAEFLFYNFFVPVEDSLLQWWWLRSGSAVFFSSLGNVLASAEPVISHNAVYGRLMGWSAASPSWQLGYKRPTDEASYGDTH